MQIFLRDASNAYIWKLLGNFSRNKKKTTTTTKKLRKKNELKQQNYIAIYILKSNNSSTCRYSINDVDLKDL